MRSIFILLCSSMILLSSCKKETSNVSVECTNPAIYQKFDTARALILAAMDSRLSDFSNIGYCDTCFSKELTTANAQVYSIGELINQTSSCYNVYHSYQGYCYKMIAGAQAVSMQTDSSEFAVLRQSYDVKFGQILNYVKSLQ